MAKIKKNVEFDMSFLVQGTITQTVKIWEDGLSPEALVKGLRSGKYATTIQENGDVIEVVTGKVVAKIHYVDNQLEYDDFELVDEDAE